MIDKDLLQIVYEDLEDITKKWNTKDISDANLRRSSDILRRLIIHGDLFKVAKLVDFSKLRLLSANEEFSSFPNPVLHQAGGGKHKGIQIKNISFYNKAFTPEEIKKDYKINKKKKNRPIKIHDFFERDCIIIQGIGINRKELINYVCNKLGGSHYDKNRNITSKKESKRKLEEKYLLLDEHKKSTILAGKNAIYFELLSIGQKLVNNRSIQKLKKRIKVFLNKK